MSTYATASDGTQLDLDSLPQTLTFSGGFATSFTIEYQGKTYVLTITYTGNNPTYFSNWVLQP